MPKHFNNISEKFFSDKSEVSTQRTHNAQDVSNKSKYYRINLKLDADLETYLKDTAWKQRTSVTQYINNLIRKDMKQTSNM